MVEINDKDPKAARFPCATSFAKLLSKIVSSPNDVDAWYSLLHFRPFILAKPNRGGTSRNLANIVLKRLTTRADDESAKSIAEPHLMRSSHNPKSDDLKLAAAVTSKIEAGSFRAAIRLICSEDKTAPTTADTYEALKKKHPQTPDDRREPCDPTGNSRFQALQVSLEDATRSLKTFPAGSSEGPGRHHSALYFAYADRN